MQFSVRLRSVRLARLIDATATANPTVQKMQKRPLEQCRSNRQQLGCTFNPAGSAFVKKIDITVQDVKAERTYRKRD